MRIEGATQQLNIINSQHKSEVPREEIGVKNNNKPTQKQTAEEKVINEKDLIKSIEKANNALNLRYTVWNFLFMKRLRKLWLRSSIEILENLFGKYLRKKYWMLWLICGKLQG